MAARSSSPSGESSSHSQNLTEPSVVWLPRSKHSGLQLGELLLFTVLVVPCKVQIPLVVHPYTFTYTSESPAGQGSSSDTEAE